MDTLSKQKILDFMEKRMNALQDQIDRDVGGGLFDRLAKWQEVKFWKEAVERKEFDSEGEGEM